MFSISNLVGTPKLGSKLEFTPIGKRRSAQNQQTIRSSPRMALNTEKVTNATFDSTFDSDHDLESLAEEQEVPRIQPKQKPGIIDGSSSIQDLQRENHNLEAENYSLKIEVATLTKFLKQTPQEARDMAYENVELKQRLARLQGEKEDQKQPKQAEKQSDSADATIRAYRKSLNEKEDEARHLEHELQLLHRKVEELQETPAVPADILQKLESLQAENQTLRRRLEDAARDDPDLLSLQKENNDLKAQLNNATRILSPNDATATLERKLRALTTELDQTERECDVLESNLRTARVEAQKNEEEIAQLRAQHEQYKSGRQNDSGKVEDARREARELKAKLARVEAQNTIDTEHQDAEIRRLQLKVETLQREIKEKDKDEYELRSQVRSLMEERTSAFGLESTLKHYRDQLESLRAREESLAQKNRELKDEISRLQDDLYTVNTDASRVAKLRDELAQLQDKLDFYEREYNLLQDAVESAEAELETYREKERLSDDRDTELLKEIELLRTRLKRAELMESQKYNESALYELESLHKRKEDTERRRMEAQIETLNLQIRKLERELETKASGTMLDTDYQRLLRDRSRLQMELDDAQIKLKENEKRNAKLESVVKDKDAVVEALESRIRDLNREQSSRAFEDPLKLKTDYEYQLRTLRTENERLQSDLEDQIRFYRTKLEVLIDRDRFASRTNGSSAIVTLLESQLEEANNLNRDLSDKLESMERVNQQIPLRVEEEYRIKIKDLQAKLNRLEEENTRLEESRRLNRELSDRIAAMESMKKSDSLLEEYRTKIHDLNLKLTRAQEEKARLEDSVETLESEARLLQSEKSRLESRSQTLSQELGKTKQHCAKLAGKINEMDLQEYKNSFKTVDDALKAKKANAQLQHQIDILNRKLANTNLSGKEDVERRLLRNEVQYFKAKLFDLNMRSNDLALMNSFIMSSIKNSNQLIKNDIVKLAQCGVYPDYAEMRSRRDGKLTLKVLATFVLSMVRLQRRSAKAHVRQVKLMLLRSDIDQDKITLLAE